MSFHVGDNFKAGPVSQVPASWFNSVGAFLNNLVGGLGIRVMRDANPPQVALDVEKAKEALAVPSVCPNAVLRDSGTGDNEATVAGRAPAAVEQVAMDASGDPATESDADKIARIGTSKFAARADHQHRDPVLHNSRQTLSEMLTCEVSQNGYGHVLSFYPPVFDPGGRFVGLSDEPAWSVDLLDNV